MKYLATEHLDGWVASLAAIGDARWGAAVVAWLVAFEHLCEVGIGQPADLVSRPRGSPLITWEASYCLTGNYTGAIPTQPDPPFLRPESVEAFRGALDHHVDEDRILAWAARFSEVPSVEATAYWLPDELLRLRRRRAR